MRNSIPMGAPLPAITARDLDQAALAIRQGLADEAEARGDANAALDVMDAFALGPDGKPFWRPWRVECPGFYRYQPERLCIGDIHQWTYRRNQ